MPAPRRIPRFLANPFTTLALLAYLVLDLTLLVRDLPNADSTIARVLSGRGAPPVAAARHDFIAACLPTGNIIIDCRGRTEVEARDMVPVGAMPILDVAFVRETSRSGFWAPTLRRREMRLDWNPRQRIPAAEMPLIRSQVADELLRLREISPADAEAFRFSDVYDGRLLPLGLLRSAVGFLVAIALPISLFSLPGYFIDLYLERINRRRGLCTRCSYPVMGLAKCPECGLPTPATTDAGLLDPDADLPK